MHPVFSTGNGADAIPIQFVTIATWPALRKRLDAAALAYADACGFEPKAGRHLLLSGGRGLTGVLFGCSAEAGRDRFLAGRLPGLLPAGHYRFVDAGDDARLAALA